jgi:hypothetical protein
VVVHTPAQRPVVGPRVGHDRVPRDRAANQGGRAQARGVGDDVHSVGGVWVGLRVGDRNEGACAADIDLFEVKPGLFVYRGVRGKKSRVAEGENAEVWEKTLRVGIIMRNPGPIHSEKEEIERDCCVTVVKAC